MKNISYYKPHISAPSGCLQYHRSSSGVIRSFNYDPSPNAMVNSIGVEGSRQIANLRYGICIAAASGSCSITYSPLSSDPYAFTMTGDVGAVDVALLGTATLQQQTCTTDFVIIGNPSQNGTQLTSGSDRFCGLGLTATTSKKNCSLYLLIQLTQRSHFYKRLTEMQILLYRQRETIRFVCHNGLK